MNFFDAIKLDSFLETRFYDELTFVLDVNNNELVRELERLMLERFDKEQNSDDKANWELTEKTKEFGTPMLVDTGKLRDSISLKLVDKKIKSFARGVKPHEKSSFKDGEELALYLNEERHFMEIPEEYLDILRKTRDKKVLKLQDKYIKIMQQKGII